MVKKMNARTPATAIRQSDLAKNNAAFVTLLDELVEKYQMPAESVALDIRYGLGDWGVLLAGRFWQVIGWEADEETAKRARVPANAHLHAGPYQPELRSHATTLLVADFNNSTILKDEPLWEAVKAERPEFVIFTDVACSKLHLNFRSYGLDHRSFDLYQHRVVDRARENGYNVISHLRAHHHAAMFVLRRL